MPRDSHLARVGQLAAAAPGDHTGCGGGYGGGMGADYDGRSEYGSGYETGGLRYGREHNGEDGDADGGGGEDVNDGDAEGGEGEGSDEGEEEEDDEPPLVRHTSLGPVAEKDLRAADVRAGVASLTTLRGHSGGRGGNNSSNGSGSGSQSPRGTSPGASSGGASSGGEGSHGVVNNRQQLKEPAFSSQCSTVMLAASQDDMSDAFLLTSMSQSSGISQGLFAESVPLSQEFVLQPSQE